MESSYHFQDYIRPYWKGNQITNETLMFVPNEKGEIEPAPLLFSPTEVLSVRSYNLQTSYQEGKDYRIEDGKFVVLPGGSIPVWNRDEYYPPEYLPNQSFGCSLGNYIRYGEQDVFTRMQIAVTYRHEEKWCGVIPSFQGERLPELMNKLKTNQRLNLVYYGDSITVGCNASGWNDFPIPPYMPIWTDLVTKLLEEAYQNHNINAVNTAVGGTNSKWGIDEMEERLLAYEPDLAMLAFGMNDHSLPAEDFKNQILEIIQKTRTKYPKTEFVLISTTLPNREAAGFFVNQEQYEAALADLVMNTPGTVLVPITSIHRYLLTKKRFLDMTGNNINHPNDFVVRAYAQAVGSVLVPSDLYPSET